MAQGVLTAAGVRLLSARHMLRQAQADLLKARLIGEPERVPALMVLNRIDACVYLEHTVRMEHAEEIERLRERHNTQWYHMIVGPWSVDMNITGSL